jgi:HK97 family phage prohead protease
VTDLASRGARRGVVEKRSVSIRELDSLVSVPDGTGGETLKFRGYASVTDTPYAMSDWLGDYEETIRSGSFGKTLAEGADVPFKVNHDGLTLARTKSGTMRLAEDSTGLHVEADLDPANPDVRSLQSAMSRGDVDEMSFGFRVVRQEWSPDYLARTITEVNLNKGDVSVVNYGANPHTSGLASLRGLDSADWTEDELREALARLEARRKPPAEPTLDLSLYSARIRLLGL